MSPWNTPVFRKFAAAQLARCEPRESVTVAQNSMFATAARATAAVAGIVPSPRGRVTGALNMLPSAVNSIGEFILISHRAMETQSDNMAAMGAIVARRQPEMMRLVPGSLRELFPSPSAAASARAAKGPFKLVANPFSPIDVYNDYAKGQFDAFGNLTQPPLRELMKIHPNWSKIGRPATEEANRESRALQKIWATRKIIIVEIHRLARLAVASSTDSGASSTESDIDLTTENNAAADVETAFRTWRDAPRPSTARPRTLRGFIDLTRTQAQERGELSTRPLQRGKRAMPSY